MLADIKRQKQFKQDYKLIGNYAGYRECHVAGAGDWLLIYKIKDRILSLARTGTHSELFE
jgi:mRNA interferase YafQ